MGVLVESVDIDDGSGSLYDMVDRVGGWWQPPVSDVVREKLSLVVVVEAAGFVL